MLVSYFIYFCNVLLPKAYRIHINKNKTAMQRHFIILAIMLLCHACNAYASMQAKTKSEIMKAYADKQYEEGDFPHALSSYIKSMETAEGEKDDDTYMACIGNIANIYEALGDYESNLFYLLKGYNMSERLKNADLRNKYLTNIVSAYCHLGNVEKAKSFFEIAKKATGSKDTVHWKYFLIYNSARIKQAEKKYKEAIAEHTKAKQYAEANGLEGVYALYQECEIGNVLVKQGDFGRAISQGRKCKDMATATGNAEMQISAYKTMYEAFASNGDADSAKKYKMLYLEAYDAAFRTKGMYKAKGRLQEYESRKSTEKINLLTSRINIYTLAVILVSALLAATVVLTIVLICKNRNLRNAQRLLINRNNDIMKSYRNGNPATLADTTDDGMKDDMCDDADDTAGGVEITQEQADELLAKINELTNRREVIADPDLSLKAIADMAKSNTKYVSFVINKTYNKNFRTYINEKRIMEACRMLSDNEHYGRMTIQAIYEEVGYTNAASFNRTFKKINGMTPAMYKKLAADNSKG